MKKSNNLNISREEKESLFSLYLSSIIIYVYIYSEHTVSREVFGKFFQELRYVGIDISPIGSRILRGEPDLSNSLTDS